MPIKGLLGVGLRTEQLRSLAEELHSLRDYPPLVSKGKGKYEGDILGFIKGLRFSARIIYYLREQLSDMNYEVSWGHLLDDEEAACSPECDIIIHAKGHIREWNGSAKDPVMHFRFIHAKHARLVISCKSKLNNIDKEYPKDLKKYGINHVFLVAECCKKNQYSSLRKRARRAGYKDLCCLYLIDKNHDHKIDEKIYLAFITAIRKVLDK